MHSLADDLNIHALSFDAAEKSVNSAGLLPHPIRELLNVGPV
jgi:hypothetical protein